MVWPSWLRYELKWFLLGTKAPDTGAELQTAENGYRDTLQCHCILSNDDGDVTRDRAEFRVRQEFDKAKAAFEAGDRKIAAFYAGAMAHYLGDLSQFCHVMGQQSHWGKVEQTVDWKARAVAAFTEAGSNGRNPGWMH